MSPLIVKKIIDGNFLTMNLFLNKEEQQCVAVGPGNTQFMCIHQVSLHRPPLLLPLLLLLI